MNMVQFGILLTFVRVGKCVVCVYYKYLQVNKFEYGRMNNTNIEKQIMILGNN